LLDLDIARRIGVEQAMGLLDLLQRSGQVLAPLAAGAVLVYLSADSIAFAGCALFAVLALLFFMLVGGRGRRARPAAAGEAGPGEHSAA
ncbi:MAG: hypothetical protein Q4F72_09405, partial [Desulfovibrionaceae bacterium]|nr:hypothetical protein [Desulfovibrionaceae bacterium]